MSKSAAGFTLIELLVVVTILGILVIISIPRFHGTRERAHRSQMESDLHTLVAAEEAYFDDHRAYTTQLADLEFNQSESVNIGILEANASGWSAQATHDNTSIICGFYIGSVTPPAAVTVDEGRIGCTQ